MMTPQEVADCTFTKSVMGGYNMAAVDDFLDKLTEDYSALYKENAALKAKLKVVVDKNKEYQDREDTIKMTLLTSQKVASSIVAEAEQKRDALIADAADGAKARLQEIQDQVAQEERRLAEVRERVDRELEAEKQRLLTGQAALRTFIRDVTAVCNSQLALLEQLPELPAEGPESAPSPEMESVPAAVQPTTAPRSAEPAAELAPDIAKELADVFDSLDHEPAPAEEAGDAAPFASDEPLDGGEDEGDTRPFDLDELQFGRNYMKD